MSQSQSRVSTGSAIAVFAILELLVFVQFILAHRDGLLTSEQMEGQGLAGGLPLAWHFGVWSDGLILSGLLAWLVLKNSSGWTGRGLLVSTVAGAAATAIMVWSYTLSAAPEAHIVNRSLTAPGWMHAVYMGIALTVVLAFYSQSARISSHSKSVVSWLLFSHVVVGTHMLLGLLDAGGTLPWYSGSPLTSAAGWAVVLFSGAALFVANVGVTVALQRTFLFLRFAGWFFAWLNDQQPKRARGFLKLLDSLVDVFLAAAVLFFIAWRLIVSGAPPLSLALFAVISVTYFMSRLSVKHELGISDKLFPPDRIPNALVPKSRFSIIFRVAVFTASYLVLTWFSAYVAIVSACLVVIGVIDYLTRREINQRFQSYFADPQYAPRFGEIGARAIEARRAVVSWYLFDLRHLRKETLRTLGFLLAFLLAAIAWLTQSGVISNAAYIVLTGVMLVNEIVTTRWRVERDMALHDIDDDLEHDDELSEDEEDSAPSS